MDTAMDAITDDDSSPEMDAARDALVRLAACLARAGYPAEGIAALLAWPCHELDIEIEPVETERTH